MRRRAPPDAARVRAAGTGPALALVVRGASGVRAWVSHSFPQNGHFSLKLTAYMYYIAPRDEE